MTRETIILENLITRAKAQKEQYEMGLISLEEALDSMLFLVIDLKKEIK